MKKRKQSTLEQLVCGLERRVEDLESLEGYRRKARQKELRELERVFKEPKS